MCDLIKSIHSMRLTKTYKLDILRSLLKAYGSLTIEQLTSLTKIPASTLRKYPLPILQRDGLILWDREQSTVALADTTTDRTQALTAISKRLKDFNAR